MSNNIDFANGEAKETAGIEPKVEQAEYENVIYLKYFQRARLKVRAKINKRLGQTGKVIPFLKLDWFA